jgi:rod shape-determining protein MreD
VRLGALVLLAVVLQISGVTQIRILGGSPDLVPLAVAAVGFFAASIPGAATGFAAGLLLDLATGNTLGSSSLVLTVVGYAVGRYREDRDPSHGLIPIPVTAAATAGWTIGIAAVSFMLGIESDVSLLVFRDMLTTVLLNSLLALPIFGLVRRLLRPVLLSDPYERRRRRRPHIESGPIGLRGLEV